MGIVPSDWTFDLLLLAIAIVAAGGGGVVGYLLSRTRRSQPAETPQLEAARFTDDPGLDVRLTSEALNCLPAHVVIIDQTGRIVASNEAWRRFGQNASAARSAIDQGANYLDVCKRAAESPAGSPQDRADALVVLEGLGKLIAGEIDELFHHYPCHSPTRQQWFQLRATAMTIGRHAANADAGPQRFVVICHEQVTEAQVAHHAMTDRSSRGSEQSRLLSLEEMASGLAHELHQPLMAISTYASGALRVLDQTDAAREDLRLPLEKLSQQTLRAQEIIKKMRSLINRQEFKPAPTDIPAIVRESVRLLEIDPRFARIRIDVEGVQCACALADSVQLQQVIVNLMRNAIEATLDTDRSSPVIVRIEQACGFIAVRVTDQGRGISREQQDRLFQPFFTTKPTGTGLGLLICEKIASLHGGSIRLETTSCQGSTFVLAIPVVTADLSGGAVQSSHAATAANCAA